MKWNKYTIKTITAAEDLISAALMEVGIEGVEIEDNTPLSKEDMEQMFVDTVPYAGEDCGIAFVSFYLNPDDGEEKETHMLKEVKKALNELAGYTDIGEGFITRSETEDKDWINNWKKYFTQFMVDDILIRPSWEERKPVEEGQIVIEIDPGTAFGTGMHETTQLCIRQLKKYVMSDTRLLDVGSGSGILAILALKLGAAYALGIDIDPHTIASAVENAEVNDVAGDRFHVMAGNLLDKGNTKFAEEIGFEKYDLITANILADVIIPLSGVIRPHLKKGGIYVVSGIIDTKENEVVNAVKENGFKVLDITRQGEWVSITAQNE